MHYHQGMKAGENTLNLIVTRVLLRSIANAGGYSPDAFLEVSVILFYFEALTHFYKDYVEFMTTPGTHNDTYAESYHRDVS